jgi:uncharacterized protein (TIGR03086 family)
VTDAITAQHRDALAATRAVVVGITDDQWTQPTPCAEWDVRALLNHVVAGNWWASRLAAGETIEAVGAAYDGDVVGSVAIDAYDASATAAAAAFEAEGALDAPCAVSYGPVPGSVYAGHRFIDVLIHGWDLSTATGQPSPITPQLAEACWGVIEPQLDLLRGSGMFGSDQAVPVGADPVTRVLLSVGRHPA